MIGSTLKHRYEVLEKVGEGNMFTVYKCDDKIGNRTVAAKVLLPQYASNRMFAERILVEAQAMVGVAHLGIVEVFDCGEEEGTYFVITEYVRGVDLKERIRRNAPFSLTTVVDVGTAILDVIDYAHKKGFVHGDLRPGNVLVTPEGQIKLADFWVSNAIAATPSIRTNAMMRSVHYMSPEVAESRTATPAADIYSLGIMLFELLTGETPFDGDTPISIAVKHSRDPVPSLRAINPGTPKSLEAVVVKALQKDPQDRFRSAKAMMNDLKSIRDALNLNKPLTWAEPTQKTDTKPLPEPEPEDELDEAEPVLLNALKKTLMIVIGLIGVVFIIMILLAVSSPADVQVPNLIGKSFEEAKLVAGEHNIRLAIRAEQFNEDHEPGTVYYMNPAAGRTIKSGGNVDVWLSKGSRATVTPNVLNLKLEDAKRRIYDAGLNVGEISQAHSDDVPAGSVMAQSPESGTERTRGDRVNFTFSLGKRPVSPLYYPESPPEIPTGEIRSFDISFPVPDGPRNQRVQIVVEDEQGTTTAFSTTAEPDDQIEETIQGIGDRVTIRIYINGRLVREERKWR